VVNFFVFSSSLGLRIFVVGVELSENPVVRSGLFFWVMAVGELLC
jgi:hypothetical protein